MRRIGFKGLHACKNALLDALAFFVAPLVVYTLLKEGRFIDLDIYWTLIAALVTSGIAYVAAFLFSNGYVLRSFAQRFSVMVPVLLLITLYWVGLGVLQIADGEGNGNVLAMLFGLVVAGALAWRKVTVLS